LLLQTNKLDTSNLGSWEPGLPVMHVRICAYAAFCFRRGTLHAESVLPGDNGSRGAMCTEGNVQVMQGASGRASCVLNAELDAPASTDNGKRCRTWRERKCQEHGVNVIVKDVIRAS
jgi:hypothetical protein